MSDNKENPYITYIRALNRSKVEWSIDAKCNPPVGKHPNMYPAAAKQQKIVATTVCTECPVQERCLFFALVNVETQGVWGGFTEAERKEMVAALESTEARGFQTNWSDKAARVIQKIAESHVLSHRIRYAKPLLAQAQT